jgi:hypothetical protein
MANASDGEGFRFIGTEIDNLIAHLEKEREKTTNDRSKRALDGAISQLKETATTIQQKYFLASWFIGF